MSRLTLAMRWSGLGDWATSITGPVAIATSLTKCGEASCLFCGMLVFLVSMSGLFKLYKVVGLHSCCSQASVLVKITMLIVIFCEQIFLSLPHIPNVCDSTVMLKTSLVAGVQCPRVHIKRCMFVLLAWNIGFTSTRRLIKDIITFCSLKSTSSCSLFWDFWKTHSILVF